MRRGTPNARTQQPNAKRPNPLGVCRIWDDVPDEVIARLVREYSAMGDGLLLGSSADREVASIRIYRSGASYSVYFRRLGDLDEALARLARYMPSLKQRTVITEPPLPVVQVNPDKYQRHREELQEAIALYDRIHGRVPDDPDAPARLTARVRKMALDKARKRMYAGLAQRGGLRACRSPYALPHPINP